MKYRSRTEIVSSILDAANGGGATKTKIIFKSFKLRTIKGIPFCSDGEQSFRIS